MEEKNMANIKRRKLPVGIQSFKKIREEGYVYVDKTDIVWELANYGDQYNYLSRPRRFGKSVLVDTLEAYFRGRKELFEGLKIMIWKVKQALYETVLPALTMREMGDIQSLQANLYMQLGTGIELDEEGKGLLDWKTV